MATSPNKIITQTLQATILSCLSNTLAQLISITRADTHVAFNFQRLLQFATFTILNTPPNILWQSFLERTFPSFVLAPEVKRQRRVSTAMVYDDLKQPSPLETDEGRKERIQAKEDLKEWEKENVQWKEEVSMKRTMSWRNTLAKFVLDQTIGALVNTIVFNAAMPGLRGEGWEGCMNGVKQNTWPLMFAGYKLWPLVSLLSFTIIPPDQRIIFGSLVGVGWGIFLSLFASH